MGDGGDDECGLGQGPGRAGDLRGAPATTRSTTATGGRGGEIRGSRRETQTGMAAAQRGGKLKLKLGAGQERA